MAPASTPSTASATPLRPTVPTNENAQLHQIIANLEAARGGTRAIVYWLQDNGKISEAAAVPLFDQLDAMGKQPAIDLVLNTMGGDAEVPWRLVTLLREYCDRLSVLLPHRAHSAGTSLALGADEIVMTPLAVLGPIDPSRTHPLLPKREGAIEAEPISVQDMRNAMQFIRDAAGAGTTYSPEAWAQIFTALFEKIHPLAIGAIEQSYALAKLVATRCLGTHMNPATESAEIKAIVDRLCDDYKSHSYEIARREARELGLKAADASPPVQSALMELLKFYKARPAFPPAPLPKGREFITFIAWLDSTHMNTRVEAINRLTPDSKVEYLADQWMPY